MFRFSVKVSVKLQNNLSEVLAKYVMTTFLKDGQREKKSLLVCKTLRVGANVGLQISHGELCWL